MSGEDEKNKRLSPQEKKRLSYENDRRNAYGESDKASRKAIPLRKKLANKQVRRGDKLALHDVVAAEESLALKRPKPAWKKAADAPLGEVVADKLAEREFLRATAGEAPVGRQRAQGRMRGMYKKVGDGGSE